MLLSQECEYKNSKNSELNEMIIIILIICSNKSNFSTEKKKQRKTLVEVKLFNIIRRLLTTLCFCFVCTFFYMRISCTFYTA